MVEFVSSDDWDLCKQQFQATTFIGKEPVVKPWNPRSKTGAAVWQAEVEDLLVWHGLQYAKLPSVGRLRFKSARQDFLQCPILSYSTFSKHVSSIITASTAKCTFLSSQHCSSLAPLPTLMLLQCSAASARVK